MKMCTSSRFLSRTATKLYVQQSQKKLSHIKMKTLSILGTTFGLLALRCVVVGEYNPNPTSLSSRRRHLASLPPKRGNFPRNLPRTESSCLGHNRKISAASFVWFHNNKEVISDIFLRRIRTIIQAQSADGCGPK